MRQLLSLVVESSYKRIDISKYNKLKSSDGLMTRVRYLKV